MANHLTKEEELTLGALVQKSLRAKALKEQAAESSEISSFELDGEVLSASGLDAVITEGQRATNKLVESNTALVWSQARKFKNKFPSAPELEDLAQEGFAGLVRAIEKYDPSRGNKLSTVAYYWIDQAINRSTNNTGRLIRLPENRITDFVDINRIRAQYEDSGLTSEQIDAIAMEKLKLTPEKFHNIITAGSIPISLNRPVSFDGGESKELMDFVSEEHSSASLEDTVTGDLMLDILYEKVSGLSQMEKDVVASSFLMGDVVTKRASMAEVRENYNLTPQKFKRVLNNALTKIRVELEALDISFTDFLN